MRNLKWHLHVLSHYLRGIYYHTIIITLESANASQRELRDTGLTLGSGAGKQSANKTQIEII